MNYSYILLGILLTISGLLFALGKIHKYLSIWKNMPEDEKSKAKIKSRCRNIGEIIMINGIIFLLTGLLPGFFNNIFEVVIIAWVIVVIFDMFKGGEKL